MAYVSVADHPCTKVHLHVSEKGPWRLECDFEDEADGVTGRVEAKVGDIDLSGTIVPDESGEFRGQRRATVVAGADGWGKTVTAKNHHNDAGVSARQVADGAAREVGETLGTFEPASETLPVDYARQAVEASTALEDAAGGTLWWVDYAGLTHVGSTRSSGEKLNEDAYEILNYNPRTGRALISVDDLSSVQVGTVLSVGTVREIDLEVTHEGVTFAVWFANDIAALLTGIARKALNGRLYGEYRYRVVKMAPDARVELQAVHRNIGLPDVLPVSQWHGTPGVQAKLKPGSEVLVSFTEGDRAQPKIRGFAPGELPDELVIGDPNTASEVACKGDTVKLPLPPMVVSGQVPFGAPGVAPGSPMVGLLQFVTPETLGTIMTGSPTVKVGQ